MTTSDYSFHDENNAFICPENVVYGLGLVRNGDEVFVSLTDSEGEGAHTSLTVEQASLAGRELLRLSVGPVYESPEELAAEIERLRRENAALQQVATRAEKDVATLTADRDRLRTAWTSARRRAVNERENAAMERFFAHEQGRDLVKLRRQAKEDNDWHEAYNQLCSDLAYEMGMKDASIAGDHQVKARVKELVADARRFLDNGARALTEESWARATAEKERDEAQDKAAAIAARIFADEQKCQEEIAKEPTHDWMHGRLVGLQRARDIATEVVDGTQRVLRIDPAPRDTELTQSVRQLVKRYGAPNVAYAAAQQAGRH